MSSSRFVSVKRWRVLTQIYDLITWCFSSILDVVRCKSGKLVHKACHKLLSVSWWLLRSNARTGNWSCWTESLESVQAATTSSVLGTSTRTSLLIANHASPISNARSSCNNKIWLTWARRWNYSMRPVVLLRRTTIQTIRLREITLTIFGFDKRRSLWHALWRSFSTLAAPVRRGWRENITESSVCSRQQSPTLDTVKAVAPLNEVLGTPHVKVSEPLVVVKNCGVHVGSKNKTSTIEDEFHFQFVELWSLWPIRSQLNKLPT